MEQIAHDTYIQKCLIYCMAACAGILTLAFYTLMIKPNQNEKSESRGATAEEITYWLNQIDPINPEKIQGFSNN